MADVKQTKRDVALLELRRLILTGGIQPGAKLNQRELAQQLGVSLTPLREALRQLEAEGLVNAHSHRGVRVATSSVDTLSPVYIVRMLLEPYAAGRAALHISNEDLDRAGMLLQELDAAHEQGDSDRVRAANYDYHFLIYTRSGLSTLERAIRLQWQMFPWDVLSVVPGRFDESRDEHFALFDALKSHDAQAAKRETETHIRESFLSIARFVTRSEHVEDPFLLSG